MEGGDEFIEIKVTSPHKVGDGMSSYMAYKVITNTNLTYFKMSKVLEKNEYCIEKNENFRSCLAYNCSYARHPLGGRPDTP